MMEDWARTKRTAIILGVVGIVIEVVAVFLLASKRLPDVYATPLIIGGMLLAFIPMFVMARRARKP
jgi:hypothetical protein